MGECGLPFWGTVAALCRFQYHAPAVEAAAVPGPQLWDRSLLQVDPGVYLIQIQRSVQELKRLKVDVTMQCHNGAKTLIPSYS